MATATLTYLGRRQGFEAQMLPYWLVLGAVMVIVLYPVILILLGSFQASRPDEPVRYDLAAWLSVLQDPSLLTPIWNTVTVTVARQAMAFPIAILLAWVIARTDIPGSHWLEFLFWIGFFLPALPVTLGWMMLLDPKFGLLNQVLTWLPFVDHGPFNIYSFWGIVWAHLGTSTIAIKVMLLTPAFRNLDASLEEASKVSGASTMSTLWRVVVPIMLPAISVVFLLSIVHSLQSFELEMILGAPFHFYVFSTRVYILLHQEPQLFQAATALSSLILVLMLPLIALQRRAVGRRAYTTVTSHFKGHKVQLGRWRLPLFYLVCFVALLLTVIPFAFLVLATFMKLFGFFNVADPWTTMHWKRVFNDPIFLASIRSTLLLAGGTAVVGVVVCTLMAYIVVRTRFAGRALLDFMAWLPATFPGIIIGLGLLWMVLATPLLRPLYGSIIVMILATLLATMTTAVQIVKANFAQLGFDLEEAARASGGTWWQACRYVLLPLITPTLLLVGALSFISAARNVSTVALVATSRVRPLSLMQLDLMVDGRYESAAVVGVVVVALTTGIALIARMYGLRLGLRS